MSDLKKLSEIQLAAFLPTPHILRQAKENTLDIAGFDPARTPDIPKPVPMPMATDDQRMEARRRSISAQIARRGRSSTILTGDDSAGETLGA